MQSELAQLKQAQQAQPSPDSSLPSSQSRDDTTHQNTVTLIQDCTVASATMGQPSHLSTFVAGPFLGSAHASTSQAASAPTPGRLAMPNFAQGTGSRYEKSIGDIRLTAGQITELFYRTLHHRFLPFTMHESSEVIYTKSPLLFWVICAAESSNRLKPRFAPHIRNLVAKILIAPTRSVETVQALLIMCMWPFNFSKLVDDASFFYCGLATQIGLQLGLHRPSLTHTHLGGSEQQDAETDFDARLTTWLEVYGGAGNGVGGVS